METHAVTASAIAGDRIARDRGQIDVGGNRRACIVKQSDPAHAVVRKTHRESALGNTGTMPHFGLGGSGAGQLSGLDLLAGLVHHPNGHVVGRGIALVKGDQVIALTAFTDDHHIAGGKKLPITDADVSRTGSVFNRNTIHDPHRRTRVAQQLHRRPITGILIASEFHHLQAEVK